MNGTKESFRHSCPQNAMNYYQLLGLRPTASRDEIRAAYLQLAQEFHPDRHIGMADDDANSERAKFKQIQEAYEVLYDPKERTAYDLKHGAIPQRRGDASNPAATSGAQHPTHVHVQPHSRRGAGGARKKSLSKYAVLAVMLSLILVSAIPRCGVLLHEMRSNIEEELSNALPSEEPAEDGVVDASKTIDVEYQAELIKVAPEDFGLGSESDVPSQEPRFVAPPSVGNSSHASSVFDMAKKALSEGAEVSDVENSYSEEYETIMMPTSTSWTPLAAPTLGGDSQSLTPNDAKFQTNHLLQQHRKNVDRFAPPSSLGQEAIPNGQFGSSAESTYTGTNRYQQLMPSNLNTQKANVRPSATNNYGGASSFDAYRFQSPTTLPENYGGTGVGSGSGLGNWSQVGSGGTSKSGYGLGNYYGTPPSTTSGSNAGSGSTGGPLKTFRNSLSPAKF